MMERMKQMIETDWTNRRDKAS